LKNHEKSNEDHAVSLHLRVRVKAYQASSLIKPWETRTICCYMHAQLFIQGIRCVGSWEGKHVWEFVRQARQQHRALPRVGANKHYRLQEGLLNAA
jgi:hypothetical protein